ncbi:TetR/AcrR family transcriptional regulator [Isoptericola hypogeus]|uniref:TetR/AcrR family transcriptional regulator n=1 Tax=Isoptericola hypogeus TaxID=300179 RepID=A0ABN2JHC4_9MICO
MSTSSIDRDDARPYHHGNLRGALLDAARAVIDDDGPAAVSLRDLARRVGVSHAAPTHHFGDKRGLMTALATDGFGVLAGRLAEVSPDAMVDLGLAYVEVATTRRADFAVMFRPDLLDGDDPGLRAAQEAAWDALLAGVRALPAEARTGGDLLTARAAWSFAHGFAALWNAGAMGRDGQTASDAARAMLQQYFG